jgi:hypothetical protein
VLGRPNRPLVAEEYNNVYLNNVLFWANQLSRGEPTFHLQIGDEIVATVSGVPLTVETTFSIWTGAPGERKRD